MAEATRGVRAASHPLGETEDRSRPGAALALGHAALMVGLILVGVLGLMLNLVGFAVAGWLGFALALLVGDLLLRSRR